jgi:hypothetical protein
MEEKVKLNIAIVALACAPLALAGANAGYPTDNVAQFVVEKLDATSLTPVLNLKKEKGKKTLADYGYAAKKINEKEALLESGGRNLQLTVLEQSPKGIYVCVSEGGGNGGQPKAQSVVLMKKKDAEALLKGHVSWREFAACPVIGGAPKQSSGNYD